MRPRDICTILWVVVAIGTLAFSVSALINTFVDRNRVSGTKCPTINPHTHACACPPNDNITTSVNEELPPPCPVADIIYAGRCSAGGYWNTALRRCVACSVGYFTAVWNNASSCVPCPAGTYADAAGATGCVVCPQNNFCYAGSTTPIACAGTLHALGAAALADCGTI